MSERPPFQKDPLLASNALKKPLSVSEIGLFLRNHPGAEIHVIEVKTGQECHVELNERGDLCITAGKSRLILAGRENQFSLAEESRTQIDRASSGREQQSGDVSIRDLRQYSALEINNILATHLHRDFVESSRKKHLEEVRAKPRQRLVQLYRTIISCEDSCQLRIRLHRIVKCIPEPAGELFLRFKWFHQYEYQARDMKKKLSAMGCKVDREGCELWFEATITQDDLEYACKNAGMDRHLYTRK